MSSHTHEGGEWRFSQVVEVRFADIDMFDHMNNAKYLTCFETGRVSYYAHVTGLSDPRDLDLTVARAEVDFIKPVFYGQTLRVYTRAGRIGNKSWTLEHEIRDEATGELMARGSTVNVHFDHDTGQSSPLPGSIVEKIESFEGRSLRGQAGAR